MSTPSLALAGLALAVWAAPGASAESSSTPPGASPPGYRSAFTDYRGYREEPARPWPVANDEMGRLGGHGGHAKGAPPTVAPAATAEPGESQPRRSGDGQRSAQ